MAQFTKITGANGVVRYNDGTQFVKTADVSDKVKESLATLPDGTAVDELGDVVDPSTETDEGSEDEVLSPAPTPTEDASTVDEGEGKDTADEQITETAERVKAEEAAKAKEEEDAKAEKKVTTQKATKVEMGGMGFPAKDGKTLSVFSKVPHETVKNIGGILVPMTHAEYNTKSDAEILARLKELGKI